MNTYLPTLALAALILAGCPTEEPANPPADTILDVLQDFGTVDLIITPDAQDVAPDVPVSDPGSAQDAQDVEDAKEEASGDSGGLDIPDNPAPPDLPPPDGPCVADCEGKLCGPDGCGGICGYCTFPEVCGPDYTCANVCETDCDGKFCGPDGCGGNCGDCQDGLDCGLDGLCYEPTCVPDCAGKVCGSDGCGADCGQCSGTNICQNGSCQLGPCGDVTDTGECDGSLLKWCQEQVILKEDDCAQYEGYSCVYDGQLNKYTCKDTGPCVPTCGLKNCGSDGCGGQCGQCSDNWSCVVGECTPEVGGACGTFTDLNGCTGVSTLWTCNPSKVLTKENCGDFGQICGFDIDALKYGCVNP